MYFTYIISSLISKCFHREDAMETSAYEGQIVSIYFTAENREGR